MSTLAGKKIIVGITGSIAAYKAVELVRALREANASVRVVLTESAKAFITPLTLQAISGQAVHEDLFDPAAEAAMGHIALARWADRLLVAPASADFIARLAHGLANDLLTTLCLATPAPIYLAPAMNQGMWHNAATQYNCELLRSRDIQLLGPDAGVQACGDIGFGRMVEPDQIIAEITASFVPAVLKGKKVLITGGPTQEPIDPVRYVTNHSSGKMSYALARAAQEAGATVTLISGPVNLTPPPQVKLFSVIHAEEMLRMVLEQIDQQDIFIAAAAVSDYRVKHISPEKIKKNKNEITIELQRNPDILSEVASLANPPFTVGFAAETENLIQQATEKLQRKKTDMMIANQVGENNTGFGSDNNAVTVLYGKEKTIFTLQPKVQLARKLIALIGEKYAKKYSS